MRIAYHTVSVLAICLAAYSVPGGALPSLFRSPEQAKKTDRTSELLIEYRTNQQLFYAAAAKNKYEGKEFQKLDKEWKAYQQEFLKQAVAAVDKYPGSPKAVDLLMQAVEADPAMSQRIYTIATQRYAASPYILAACKSLSYSSWSAVSEKLLVAVKATNPSKECRAMAAYAQGHQLKNDLGVYASRKLTDAERTKAVEDAVRYYSEVINNYADVKIPEFKDTLGEMAKRGLEGVNNAANLAVGKVAPEIVGADLDGVAFKSTDYRGKVLVIDFWGNW